MKYKEIENRCHEIHLQKTIAEDGCWDLPHDLQVEYDMLLSRLDSMSYAIDEDTFNLDNVDI